MGDNIRYINNTVPEPIHCYVVVPYATSVVLTFLPAQIRGDYRKPEARVYTNFDKLQITTIVGNFITPLTFPNNGKAWNLLKQYYDANPWCLPLYFDHKIAETYCSFPNIYQHLIKAPINKETYRQTLV